METLDNRLMALRKEGKKLLGCFPLYPPIELFHAMDLAPVVMWGLKPFFPTTLKSDQHLQNFVCSIGRHLTEFVLSEAGTLLDGLFMYNACDTLRNLPEILQSGLEDGGRQLPVLNIHVPMPPLRQTDGGQYLRNETDALINEIEAVFGARFSENRFKESVRLYRKSRLLARQLEKAVAEGRIGFNVFANLFQGNYFRSVEKQIDAMESVLARIDLQNPAGNASGKRVILSGILPPPAGVTEIIEAAGLKIVGNDIASLARSYAYTPDTDCSPTDYYVDFYYNRPPCPTLLGSSDVRPTALEALIAKRNAEGIIFLGEKFCEYEYFEFPYLQKRFKQKGLSTLLLEFAIDDDHNLGQVRTRIEAFSEII